MKSTIVPAMGKCIIGALLLTICISMTACDLTKVDTFDKPSALETYQGPLEVDFAIKDTYPKGLTTMIVQFYSNKKGDEVIFYGLPPGQPYFEIIPEEAYKELKKAPPLAQKATKITPTPMVSGLRGKVLTPTRVEITGFADASRLAKELGVEVTGTIVIDGRMLTVLESDPITIWVKVGDLKKMLPKEDFMDQIIDLETNQRIAQAYDDNQKVAIYVIKFAGQSMTFAF